MPVRPTPLRALAVALLVLVLAPAAPAAPSNGPVLLWKLEPNPPRYQLVGVPTGGGAPSAPIVEVTGGTTQFDVSPTGRVAVAATDGTITVAELDGSGRTGFDLDADVCGFPSAIAWSADGTRLAVAGSKGICTVTPTGASPTLVADEDALGGQVAFEKLSWAPDGRRIVFGFAPTGGAGTELWTVDVAARQAARLRAGLGSAPQWSPDGTTIAFIGTTGSGAPGDPLRSAIRRVDPDGTDDRLLADIAAASVDWSPDGTRLVYFGYPPTGYGFVRADGTGAAAFDPGLSLAFPYVEWAPGADTCGAPAAKALRVGLVEAQGCFTERVVAGKEHSKIWETTEDAFVGGFRLRPAAGAKLVLRLDRAGARSGLLEEAGGQVDLVVGDVPLGFDVGLLPVALPQGEIALGGAGSQTQLFMNAVMQALGFRSFPASASTKLVWVANGTGATLTAAVAVDDLMKALGDAVSAGPTFGGLSGTVLLKAVNGKGIEVQTAEVKVAKMGVLIDPGDQLAGLDTFKLTYALRDGRPALRGEVKISIPRKKPQGSSVSSVLALPAPKPLVLGGSLTWADGGLVGAGLSVDGLSKPLGSSGIILRGVAGELVTRPKPGFVLAGSGDFVPTGRGNLLEGTVELKGFGLATECLTGSGAVELRTQYTSSLLESKGFGKLTGDGVLCSYLGTVLLEVNSTLDLRLDAAGQEGVLGVKTAAKGWQWLGGMGIEGSATLKLPILPTSSEVTGTFVASTAGYAACASFSFFSGGFGQPWLAPAQTFQGCDLAAYRALPPPRSGPTRARATTARAVTAGARLVAFRAVGADGPPAVALVGPGGARFVAPADGRLVQTADVVIGTSEPEKAVFFVVRRPAAGQWRIETTDPARPAVAVSTADAAPDAGVRATVTGTGERRVVRYAFTRSAGRTVQLALRAGKATLPLGTPRVAARGKLAFSPHPTVRRQAIVATVLEGGVPRATRTVARFTVAPVRRPGRVAKLVVRREKGALVVRFRRTARATSYVVVVRKQKRVLVRLVTTSTRVRIAGAPAGALAVSVAARDRLDRPGPVATAAVRR